MNFNCERQQMADDTWETRMLETAWVEIESFLCQASEVPTRRCARPRRSCSVQCGVGVAAHRERKC